MEEFLKIAVACVGSTGLFAFIQFLITRHDNKNGTLSKIASSQRRIEIANAQTHLLLLVEHYPNNHKAILSEAEYYFFELGSDSWVYGIIKEWAKKEGLNIDYLEEVHLRNQAR